MSSYFGDTGDEEDYEEEEDFDEWLRQEERNRRTRTPHQDEKSVLDDEKEEDDEPSLQGRVNLRENVNLYKVEATPARLKAAARLEGAKSRGFTRYETTRGQQKRQTMETKVDLKKREQKDKRTHQRLLDDYKKKHLTRFDTTTPEGKEKFDAFQKRWANQPDSVWLNLNECTSVLSAMNQDLGVAKSQESITDECVQLAKNMGGTHRATAIGKAYGEVETEKILEQGEIDKTIKGLMGIASQNKLDNNQKYRDIMALDNDERKVRELQTYLGSKGKSLGVWGKIAKRRPIGRSMTDKMDVSLDIIKNTRTSASKRASETAKLQSLADAATATGQKVPAGVAAYLATAKTQDADTETSGFDSEEKESLADRVGNPFSGMSLGRGGGGDDDEYGGGSYSRGGGMSEMFGVADASGGMDTDSLGQGDSPLSDMSQEHDQPAHRSLSVKSTVLGKETVGSGGLFESSMAESGAGVGLGDWNPRAFDVAEGGETRGEKFLRKQRAPTQGEEGPLGGDIQPGSMSLFSQFGATPGSYQPQPGNTTLDLGAGQYTPSTPINLGTKRPVYEQGGDPLDYTGVRGARGPNGSDIAEAQPRRSLDLGMGVPQGIKDAAARIPDDETYHKQTQQRGALNLGLKQDQKPTTGINILGMSSVKAPDVNSIVKETNIPTNRPMASGVINQHKKSGLDVGHLIGSTPKKKKKMNLFGGLPR